MEEFDNFPMVRVPRYYTPERVMADADGLREKIIDYFSLRSTGDVLRGDVGPPTPSGLAMAIGLSGWDSFASILKRIEDAPDHFSVESVHCIEIAKSLLEDWYVKYGLKDAIPAAFTKFLMSSYLNRSEKTSVANTMEANATLTIHVQSDKPASIEELREFDRLERALGEQTRNELIALGRYEDAGAIEIIEAEFSTEDPDKSGDEEQIESAIERDLNAETAEELEKLLHEDLISSIM